MFVSATMTNFHFDCSRQSFIALQAWYFDPLLRDILLLERKELIIAGYSDVTIEKKYKKTCVVLIIGIYCKHSFLITNMGIKIVPKIRRK